MYTHLYQSLLYHCEYVIVYCIIRLSLAVVASL